MRSMLVLLFLMLSCCVVFAADESAAIKQVLAEQAAAWNRGDLVEFMRGYENSPTLTFIGKDVERGYDKVLARYQRTYGSAEKRGKLQFVELEVRMLGDSYALLTGKFQLTRTAAGGGDASGRFSLVLRKTAQKWKVIHDHTGS